MSSKYTAIMAPDYRYAVIMGYNGRIMIGSRLLKPRWRRRIRKLPIPSAKAAALSEIWNVLHDEKTIFIR